MRSAITAFLLFFAYYSFAQEMDVMPPPTKKDIVEITLTDFTKIDSFQAKNARVFGMALGMTEAQAEKIASYDMRISVEQDKLNGQRRYIFDSCDADNDTAEVVLGYLKWDQDDPALSEIVLYETFWQFTTWPAACCDLFSDATQDPDSDLYRHFFGKPAKRKVILNIPSIGLKIVQFFYPEHNMIITQNTDDDLVTYTVSFVRKME